MCGDTFRLSIHNKKLLQKAKFNTQVALLNIILLAIAPRAGAHFKPEIDQDIFCPSGAEKVPSSG
jgi:hypothetical protein